MHKCVVVDINVFCVLKGHFIQYIVERVVG